MTVINHYERADEVFRQVRRVRDLWWSLSLGRGVLTYVAVAAGALLFATGFEGLFHTGSVSRTLLLSLVAAAALVGLFVCLLRPVFRQVSEERVARLIELHYPELDNGLINAVQLARDAQVPSRALVQKQLAEVAEQARGYDLRRAVDRRPFHTSALAAAAVLTLLVLYILLSPARFTNALVRILHPRSHLPVVGAVRIEAVEPGSTTVIYGSDLDVRVTLKRGSPEVGEGRLKYSLEKGGPQEELLVAVGPGMLAGRIEDITVPLSYYVAVGDSESDLFEVSVAHKPAVERLDVTYEYPAYTGLEPKTDEDSLGNLSALRGSYAELTIYANAKISQATLEFDDGVEQPVTVDFDNRVLRAKLALVKSGSYTIHLRDTSGYTNEPPAQRRIDAIADAPPRVTILSPVRDETLTPGGTVEVVVKASDNFGLTSVKLHLRRNDGATEIVETWAADGRRDASFTRGLTFPVGQYHDGDTVTLFASASDNCTVGGPGTSESRRVLLHIKDPAEARRKRQEQFAGWEEELRKILELQKETRETSLGLGEPMGPTTFRSKVDPVRTNQVEVRARTLALADDIDSALDRLRPVKRTLLALGSGQMVEAVVLTDDLLRVDNPPLAAGQVVKLLQVQKRIIATLEKLLQVLPVLTEQVLEEMQGREASDLPTDVEEKLRELAKKLEEFVDQQKKVVDASEDLRKRPVEDLTEQDEAKLRELEAIEDDWAKFMKEAYADFSKLPDQDFSNPSLLKEILEIQSDVEMAADALSQKAVEMAVPLEQSGLELAEELTTHIEKWLDDEPDRLKWVMEEPLTEYEVPMAELPAELEDIIGELMEQEEDLFEDVEDTTSAWADSLDKGAGWTAMDGPISNMSAQGVTGNVLPNSSEIGGRSGEGRTGKAHGEMVEDTATGKGGRRTPTRLTPDPFQAGQIDDRDPEPAGGATGGGKLSGAGGEGLEGPVPPQLSQEMKRLAGNQAQLRNRAESVALQFKVANYPTYQLEEAITTMEQIELDLRSGRYRNVLRQKPVLLRTLKDTRAFLVGEIRTSYDRSAPLPPYLRDQLSDARSRPAPEGYQDLIDKYYERLSERR